MIFFRYTFILLLLPTTFNNAYPIAETTALSSAAVGGIASALATGLATHYALKHTGNCSGTTSISAGILSGLATGWASSYLLYKNLQSLTPDAKFTPQRAELRQHLAQRNAEESYSYAQKFYENLAEYTIFSDDLSNVSTLYQWALVNFGTTWPLVKARENLVQLNNKIAVLNVMVNDTFKLIKSALSIDAENKAIYEKLTTACSDLLNKTEQLDAIREARIRAITQNSDYQQQVYAYEKYRADQREAERLEEVQKEVERKHERELELELEPKKQEAKARKEQAARKWEETYRLGEMLKSLHKLHVEQEKKEKTIALTAPEGEARRLERRKEEREFDKKELELCEKEIKEQVRKEKEHQG